MSIKRKILTSIKPLIKNSTYVSLNSNKLIPLAQKLYPVHRPPWDNTLQFLGNEEDTCHYYFFVDNLNFCSWPAKGKEKWFYNNNGEWISGYYAKSVAIKHAFETTRKFLDANFLANITYEDFKNIFQGKGELQLMKERHQIIQDGFRTIVEKYNGKVIDLIRQANFDANTIVEILIDMFPRFRDMTLYQSKPVYFLKLAQIYPSDINYALSQADKPYIMNLEDLTIFADTLIPQLLQAEGVLVYDERLISKLQREELIPSGSLEEMEIRAHTIYACELLRDEIEKLERSLASNELDWILWSHAKQRTFQFPYHRTLGIYY